MQIEPRTVSDSVLSKQRATTSTLALLMCLYTLLITFSCLVVGTRFVPPVTRSEVEGAALDVARTLATVSVTSRRFGAIRLCDTVNDNGTSTPGLNSLAATIRLDGIIAKTLGMDYITQLVQKDAEEIEHLNKELAHNLYRVIQPNYYLDTRGERISIYERAYKAVTRGSQGRTLVGLKINLGKLQSYPLNSMTPAVRSAGLESLKYDDGKYYICHMPIPVADSKSVSFYELAPEPMLVDGSQFIGGSPAETSSVVLLEATFESLDNSGFRKIVTRETSCAVVGGTAIKPVDGALVLSFPSGGLNQFSSLKDIATCRAWNKSGEWQQAVDGPVPGEGHLAPPLGIETADAPPGEAIALSIYHWMVSMGPAIKPELFEKMFLVPFPAATVVKNKLSESNTRSQKYSNSAIVRDTGAARFALLSQSKPQGLGQQILGTAFSRALSYPGSAIPVAVDQNGTCRLAGRDDCDSALVRDFLNDLYKTNVAAIETKSVAELVMKRVENAKQECFAKIAVLTEEKRSLSSPAQAAGKLLVDEKIRQEETNKTKYTQVAELAIVASTHSKKAIEATYEMAGEMSRFASLGLDRVTGDTCSGYILSRSLVFVPHTRALSETDLYESAEVKLPGGSKPKVSDWLQTIFEVAETPDETMRVNGIPIVQFWQTEPRPLNNGPKFVILSSGELRAKGYGRPCVLNFSPYSSGGVGRSQLLYYAPEAVHSERIPEVHWSLLIRDLVAFQDAGAGHPPSSETPAWWTDSHLEGDVPALCVEVQVRTPVPSIPDIPSGTSVQDPNLRESIPLVPPMPAELL